KSVYLVRYAKVVVVDVLAVRAVSGLVQLANVAAYEDLEHVTLGRDGLPQLQEIALDEEQLAERGVRAMEVRAGFLGNELLEQLDPLAELVDDLEILIHHRVEERVQEQAGRLQMSFDEPLLAETPRHEVALVHCHERAVSDEDRNLVLADAARHRRRDAS